MVEQTRQERFAERYAEGRVPWDDTLPPPELRALGETMPPGRALDLGCGYGRSAVYLAQLGWQVDGVDFVPQAIAGARDRAETAGVAARTCFHVGSVTHMPFLAGPYDLALDIGCMHGLPEAELVAYRDEVARLLRPQGTYLLFAHLREEEPPEGEPRWVTEEMIHHLFGDGFALLSAEHGVTQVEDKPPWPSAWFRFLRR